jgi:predicted O-methyltransferase YrrM
MLNDNLNLARPAGLDALLAATAALGFTMQCEDKTGALLRLLAATKPGGRLLEIGTGTGVSACWLLDGMDERSTLVSVEREAENQQVAQKHLGEDPRLELHLGDAVEFIKKNNERFDLVFADTFPGKFTDRDAVLDAVKPSGYYVIDDLLPQVNWPDDDHPIKVRELVKALEADGRFHILKLNWASGIVVGVKKTG